MKTNKFTFNILISIFIFALISIISIYTTIPFLNIGAKNLYLKQLLFYLIGLIATIFITYKGFNLIKKHHFLIYIGINVLLLFLLLYGIEINGSKCWIFIGSFSFQPSELMKISLVITLSVVISKFKETSHTMKEEFFLLLKLGIITLIPCILTFLEPDTGVVIIYLLTLITLIIFSGINKKWYIIAFLILIFLIVTGIILYLTNKDFLLNIIPSSLFYRLDRIINWKSSSGYQLEQSLIAISSGGLWGFGFNQNPVYFPEPQTDFIFATYAANFGFLGAVFLLITIIFFNTSILRLSLKKISLCDKYIILGIFIILFYGQLQNISMTLGLLPITGIPLPFISYGGSSLISYMAIIGIILNINKNIGKYRN